MNEAYTGSELMYGTHGPDFNAMIGSDSGVEVMLTLGNVIWCCPHGDDEGGEVIKVNVDKSVGLSELLLAAPFEALHNDVQQRQTFLVASARQTSRILMPVPHGNRCRLLVRHGPSRRKVPQRCLVLHYQICHQASKHGTVSELFILAVERM